MSSTAGHRRNGKSPTFNSWENMRKRCEQPSAAQWSRYGARGIAVCARWKIFANFLADMGERPPGMTLDRIDNSKGYEPGNCRWATRAQQDANRSNSRRITFRGETRTLAEWARSAGLATKRLHHRLALGWSVERALTTPVVPRPGKAV